MKVAAVVNYKGGVGKTTLTANLGAQLALFGRRVLLIDVDPQASLSLSFYTPEQWERDLASDRTIRNWYDRRAGQRLVDLVTQPPEASFYVGGRLGLIASDLFLTDAEERLARRLTSVGSASHGARFLQLFDRLRGDLETVSDAYDVALIDCPPNFGIVTRTAIIASDGVLVPARPDMLSTFAVDHLLGRMRDFKREYYSLRGAHRDRSSGDERLPPGVLGVVFNQVPHGGGSPGPNPTSQGFIDGVRQRIPTFDTTIRQSQTAHAHAAEHRYPAVLDAKVPPHVAGEFEALAEEFESRMENLTRGR